MAFRSGTAKSNAIYAIGIDKKKFEKDEYFSSIGIFFFEVFCLLDGRKSKLKLRFERVW